METLRAELTVSMSDFKKNPAKIVREAGSQPVAVLSHNKAAFYMIDPASYESLLEDLADAKITPLIKKRMSQRSSAIKVDIDSV